MQFGSTGGSRGLMVKSQIVLVTTVLVLVLWTNITLSDSTYFYSDDFTTDKVVTDCIYSSEIFYYQGPDLALNGYLVLWPYSSSNDRLLFRSGFLVDAWAYLHYQLPLVSSERLVTGGTISFDLAQGGTYGFLQAALVCDNGEEVHAETFTLPGHYVVDFTSPSPCQFIRLLLSGDGVALDGFAVELLLGEEIFACGDVDGNGSLNLLDAIALGNYIFGIGEPASGGSMDVNCDGSISMSDVVYLIWYIFSTGTPPCDPDGDGVQIASARKITPGI